jgi:hypothetical protein
MTKGGDASMEVWSLKRSGFGMTKGSDASMEVWLLKKSGFLPPSGKQ